MSEPSPWELIERALRDRAKLLHKEAALRGNGGPRNAGYRSALRIESRRCAELAASIRRGEYPPLGGAQ